MKYIKETWENIPAWLRGILIIALLYKAYILVKTWLTKQKEKNYHNNDQNSYYNSGGSIAFNSRSTVKKLWSEFFDSPTEDEDKIIRILNEVPPYKRHEVYRMYGDYLIEQKENKAYHWFNYYKGKNLQADAKYFLGDDFDSVEHFFDNL